MGDPEWVLGRGGGGSEVDDALFSKEDAEVAKLHKVEEFADDEEDDEDKEVLTDIGPFSSFLSIDKGSTGL